MVYYFPRCTANCYSLIHWLLFVGCSVYYKPVANSCTAVTMQTMTENYGTKKHTQDTTAPQPTVFLTGIHWLLVITDDGVTSDFFPPVTAAKVKASVTKSTIVVCALTMMSLTNRSSLCSSAV